MNNSPSFKRILLKLSGEALKGDKPYGIDGDATMQTAERIKEIKTDNTQIALVIGAGNIFRGLPASRNGMRRNTADSMGMLATVMNAIAMRDALEASGLRSEIQTPWPVPDVSRQFDHREAEKLLKEGVVVIFAGGTGHPFFTTDTTSALRACEIEADAIFKATKVDGVYTADPMKDPDAKRYRRLNYADALSARLGVMDSTAFSLCRDNSVPIVVFNFNDPDAFGKALNADDTAATIVGDFKTIAES